MRLAAFLTVALATAVASANSPEPVQWQVKASRLRGRAGDHAFYCPPAGILGAAIYGTDVYALESSLCGAAAHAGVIDAKMGGTFLARLGAPAHRFTGTFRNGLASQARSGEQWSFSVFPIVVAQPVPVPVPQPVPYPVAPPAPVPYDPPVAPAPYHPSPAPMAPPAPTPAPPMRVFAPGLAGQWRDVDGDVWTIPVDNQGDFDLAYRSRDGRRQQLFFARWLDGLVGTEFEARVEEDMILVTYSPAMPDRVRVKMRGQKLFWTRLQ